MSSKNLPTLDPHQRFRPENAKEQMLLDLLKGLWKRYRGRVAYVRIYEQVVAEAGGAFENDHIAFRTIAAQEPYAGIATLSRIFEALGYQAAGCYRFPDKQLSAIHFQHPKPGAPKLFISELQTWELPQKTRRTVLKTIADRKPAFSDARLAELANVEQLASDAREKLLNAALRVFRRLPWSPPKRKDVIEVNEVSQYAAWVLVHGYEVNHFTALVNSHGVDSLSDIDKTVEAMKQAGIPMKESIEGEPGSRLRQTATEAVETDVSVRNKSDKAKLPWTYAYFEIAERGEAFDPERQQSVRFEGFLGPQATQLFEMTRMKQ